MTNPVSLPFSYFVYIYIYIYIYTQCVPLATELGITTATYMEIFNIFVNQMDDEELSIGYFQQDGATSHTSHVSMAEIQSFFDDAGFGANIKYNLIF